MGRGSGVIKYIYIDMNENEYSYCDMDEKNTY